MCGNQLLSTVFRVRAAQAQARPQAGKLSGIQGLSPAPEPAERIGLGQSALARQPLACREVCARLQEWPAV
jgi:hypothetical protein